MKINPFENKDFMEDKEISKEVCDSFDDMDDVDLDNRNRCRCGYDYSTECERCELSEFDCDDDFDFSDENYCTDGHEDNTLEIVSQLKAMRVWGEEGYVEESDDLDEADECWDFGDSTYKLSDDEPDDCF